MALSSSNNGRKDNENPEIFEVSQSKWDRLNGSSRRQQHRRLTWDDIGSFSQSKSASSTSSKKTKTNTIDTPYFVAPPGFDSFGGGGGGFDDEGNVDDDVNHSTNNNIDSPFDGSSCWMVPTTAEDKAILKNLTDIRHATTRQKRAGGSGRGGRDSTVSGVSLLESCGGLILPTKHVASEVLKLSSPIFPLVSVDDDGTNNSGGGDNDDDDRHDEEEVAAEDFFGAKAAADGRSGGGGDDDDDDGEIDAAEIFDIIRNIQDPEHPHTLEELGVVSLEQVELLTTDIEDEISTANTTATTNQNKNKNGQKIVTVSVRFTPTIPHCSMATLIGLCLRVKLLRSLPSSSSSSRKFQILVQIEPGTHASENAINKQLRDKERVCAALENKHLNGVVNKCIKNE